MLYSLKSYFLLIATCVFFVSPGNAQKCMQYYRGGLSASVGVNSGFSKTTFSQDTTKRTSRLGLNLNVAYAINQTILTGIEVNAWSLSSRSFFNFDSGVRTPEANTNDFLVNSSIIAQIYPFAIPIYFKGGIGRSLFIPTTNTKQSDSGPGYSLGCGYEKTWNGLVGLGIFLNYNLGKLKNPLQLNAQQNIDRSYDIINIGVNFIVF